MSMMKNLTVKGGNCNHLKYAAKLLEMVRAGVIKTERILTKHQSLSDVLDAYRHFDKREPGWVKVELRPAA
jgi:threonine dehydrogenase-like Zn-dependent dehydrogenase